MKTQTSERMIPALGFVLLMAVFVFSLFEAHKINRDVSNQSVRVTLKTTIRGASQVKIAGSFNNWQAHCCLAKAKTADEWTIELLLQPGRYEYVYIVDGERWLPEQSGAKLQDGLGGRNNVLYVKGSNVNQGGGNV